MGGQEREKKIKEEGVGVRGLGRSISLGNKIQTLFTKKAKEAGAVISTDTQKLKHIIDRVQADERKYSIGYKSPIVGPANMKDLKVENHEVESKEVDSNEEEHAEKYEAERYYKPEKKESLIVVDKLSLPFATKKGLRYGATVKDEEAIPEIEEPKDLPETEATTATGSDGIMHVSSRESVEEVIQPEPGSALDLEISRQKKEQKEMQERLNSIVEVKDKKQMLMDMGSLMNARDREAENDVLSKVVNDNKVAEEVKVVQTQTQPQTQLQPQLQPQLQTKSTAGATLQRAATTTAKMLSKHEFNLNKYGRTTKVIGKGTGGTVRLLQGAAVDQRPPSLRNVTNTSQADGSENHCYSPAAQKLFAVKEFRRRRADETPRAYMKKVTSEFCIGSSLHHENVIETLDLIFEGERVYEIMEYCPYDLFKFVAIGDLALDESLCLFKQLCRGVEYIHNLGIAHRDLKLENVLLSEEGIVKLIDFGCATVFKAPFQKQPNKVLGIYGSDPYIAPEVFNKTVPYNAEASDNWSIGIIYLCMFMLKFPWKIADASLDKNYATFIKNWPHGRDRLFNQLPTKLDDDARPWVTGLVDLDPENRPHLKDMMEANWLKNIDICVPGKKATSHTHSFLNK